MSETAEMPEKMQAGSRPQGKSSPKLVAGPRVVGTVHSPGSLRQALRLKPGAVDLLELRVDHFADDLRPLRQALPRLAIPYLVTVRHPAEGGAHGLTFSQREELYREFMPPAEFIDLEARSMPRLEPLVVEAQARGVGVIISTHFFKRAPSLATLKSTLLTLRRAGADVAKIAARTEKASEVAALLQLLDVPRGGKQLSVMGMGPLGKASRLLFARASTLR